MAIIITNNPILDARDLASLQSASNRDPRMLVNVLATLVRKIGAWKLVAESIVLTDGSGRKLGEFGDNITTARNMKVKITSVAFNLTSLSSVSVLSIPGSGILRKIAIRVTTAVTGIPQVILGSPNFDTNVTLYNGANTFYQEVVDLASRYIGTGANIGDHLLLDSMNFEFSGGLSMTLAPLTAATTGALQITVWYDSM